MYKFLKSNTFFTRGFWIILFLIFWLQVVPQSHSILEATLFSFLLVYTINFPATYLSRNLLLKAIRAKEIKTFLLQFLLVSILIGVIFGGYLLLFSFLEQKGIFPKSDYFEFDGITIFPLGILLSAGIFINLCFCGLRFLLEYIKSQEIIHEYQLRTLQHQFTPHFMFNVLNHIHVLIETDTQVASSLLIRYSEILRYQLYNGEKELVHLKDEIQFLKDFIAVEELRWDDKLTVSTHWNVENEDIEIHALLFITFVENAFKHVSRTNLEKGFVNLNFEQKDNTVRLEIENSKSLIEKKKNHSGLGLKNIRERLEILYHNNHTLTIEETETTFRIRLELNLQLKKTV